MLRAALFAFAMLLWAGAATAAELVMVEQAGCPYCTRWNRDLADIYPKTPEGKFAPLVRTDISAPEPQGVTFDRKVVFTPTFVLIEDGKELGRIEGYPGQDFFWGLLEMLLENHTSYEGGVGS